MPVLFEIVGESYVDYFCFLGTKLPDAGGDSSLTEPVQRYAGGSPLNTATHLVPLRRQRTSLVNENYKEDAVVVQTILNSNDDNGQLLLSHANRCGFQLVNCHATTEPDRDSTPHCVVIVTEGDRRFLTHRGCAVSFGTSSLAMDRIRNEPSPLHLHIAGFFCTPGFNLGLPQALEQLRNKRSHPTIVSLVTQYDVTEQWDAGLETIAPFLDIVIMNETEANCILEKRSVNKDAPTPNWIDFYSSWSASTFFVITLGSKGALAFRDHKLVAQCEKAPDVPVVDPTGAGDAFAAGLLHGLWKSSRPPDWSDQSIQHALEWGCAVGTASVTVKGASQSIDMGFVNDLLQRLQLQRHAL